MRIFFVIPCTLACALYWLTARGPRAGERVQEIPPAPQALVPEANAEFQQRLQARLDAAAQAYNEGEPDAEWLDYERQLGLWKQDWQALKHRKLRLTVHEITLINDLTIASWDFDLTADIPDGHGPSHAFHMFGTQQGGFVKGDPQVLGGPVVYLSAARTTDGRPWVPSPEVTFAREIESYRQRQRSAGGPGFAAKQH